MEISIKEWGHNILGCSWPFLNIDISPPPKLYYRGRCLSLKVGDVGKDGIWNMVNITYLEREGAKYIILVKVRVGGDSQFLKLAYGRGN